MKYINLVNPVNPVKKLTRQGFTIIELLVAMSLLVILLGLAAVVFNTTVAAHRAAGATIDISRNLHAITDQLNADFKGLRKDAPVFVAFNWIDTNGDSTPDSRFDTIHFFADGDFETTRQYVVRYDSNYNGVLEPSDATRPEIIKGNVARVFYGHSNVVTTPFAVNYAQKGLLSRKSHILSSHAGVQFQYGQIPKVSNWPTMPAVFDYGLFDDTSSGMTFGLSTELVGGNTYKHENLWEFNTITPTDWINTLNYLDPDGSDPGTDPDPLNANHFITYCMSDASRPLLDLGDINRLHLLLAQGIVQMRIQWAYTNDDLLSIATGLTPSPAAFAGVRWWPDIDPDGSGNSDFGPAGMNRNQFGVYFTLPGGATSPNWFAIGNCKTSVSYTFKDTFYPAALKFTFVLKDSNGVFDNGKIFTHIVYLDN